MALFGGGRDSQESKDLEDAARHNAGFQILVGIGAVLFGIGVIVAIINGIF